LAVKNQTVNQGVAKISKRLEEVRDMLFECSRQCVNGGGGEWQTAEALFALAKNADFLRQQVTRVTDVEPAPLDQRMEAKLQAGGEPEVVKPSRKRKADYPKFVLRSDCLLKIGLSRDKRTEYEHEVPRPEFDKIIARLVNLAPANKEITVEEIQADLDCPSYQTYVVIAVLLQMGLLTSPWRGAYKIRNARQFASEARGVWSRLPQM
jgi:hypothetical protein